jgi:hypothetical protein
VAKWLRLPCVHGKHEGNKKSGTTLCTIIWALFKFNSLSLSLHTPLSASSSSSSSFSFSVPPPPPPPPPQQQQQQQQQQLTFHAAPFRRPHQHSLLRFPKAKQHFQKVEPDSGSDFKRKEQRNVHFQKTELKAVQESDMKAWRGGLGRFQRSLFSSFVQRQLVEDP